MRTPRSMAAPGAHGAPEFAAGLCGCCGPNGGGDDECRINSTALFCPCCLLGATDKVRRGTKARRVVTHTVAKRKESRSLLRSSLHPSCMFGVFFGRRRRSARRTHSRPVTLAWAMADARDETGRGSLRRERRPVHDPPHDRACAWMGMWIDLRGTSLPVHRLLSVQPRREEERLEEQ